MTIPNNLGRKHSDETKRKISLSHIGMKLTEESKRKISLANKGRISPMRGKKHTEETKERIRLKKLGSIPTNKMFDICTIEGCGKKHDARGFCASHYMKDQRSKFPEKYREIRKKSYWNRVEYNRKAARDDRQFRRLVAIAVYSNETYKCACCGEDEYLFLSIDHVNNDGHVHRKEIGSGRLYQWLWNEGYPEGFQILCYNCNFVKGWYGSCLVHKKEGDTL